MEETVLTNSAHDKEFHWKRLFQWLHHRTHTCLCIQNPENLIRSHWPINSFLWLTYRICMASVVSTSFLFNFLNLSLEHLDIAISARFFIYLTNWGFCLVVACFVLKAHLALKFFSILDGTRQFSSTPSILLWSWVLSNTSSAVSLGVSVGYWTVVYSGWRINVPDLNSHVLNSVVTIVDSVMVESPVYLMHFYQPYFIGIIYFCFTYIFYVLGGTDQYGNRAIYPLMDWGHPLRSVLIGVVGGSSVLLAVHCMLWAIFYVRQSISPCVGKNNRISTEIV